MHKRILSFTVIILVSMVALVSFNPTQVFSQNYKDKVNPAIYLDRGLVWDSVTGTLHGSSLYSFTRNDHGYDFPGFEPDLVQAENVGTWATHHDAIMFAWGANRVPVYPGVPGEFDNQFIWINTDYGTSMSTDMSDTNAQNVMTSSIERWKNGENYFLQVDPLEAEEVCDIAWQYNPNFKWRADQKIVDRHHQPLKVEKKVRQWSGSRQNQMWFIHDWKITNMSDNPVFSTPEWEGKGQMTLYDFVFQFAIAGENNRRSSSFLGYPNSPDDFLMFDPDLNLVIQYDGNYIISSDNDTYDYFAAGGPGGKGEFLAPGHIGTALLYTTPNRDGKIANLLGYWGTRWYARGSGDWQPWQGAHNYLLLCDMSKSAKIMLAGDWGQNPIFQVASTGVWDIAPGESIRIVWFSGMSSVDLETCYGTNASIAKIATGVDSMKAEVRTAKLATYMALVDGYAAASQYKGWNIPDPPACPMKFEIKPYYGEVPGNMVTWGDECEKIPDYDYTGDERFDLDSYTVWRSEFLPFEGWHPVANFKKGDPNYYNASTKTYTFVDKAKEGDIQSVKVGFNYYYAISTCDKGHTTWPPKPEAFPKGVPPQQSNLQASHNYHFDKSKWKPFRTLRPPGTKMADIRVVPNPFIMQAGFTTPRDIDTIQFINLPGKCTIRIYSVRGDIVQVLEHIDGSGTQVWNQRTKGEQFAESGIYIYKVESHADPTNGLTYIDKFVIVR